MLEIIIGLVAEPMSPVVAVRLMLAPVMVMAVVLVIVSRVREKVLHLPAGAGKGAVGVHAV